MEGLEISIVSRSEAMASAVTQRIDPEYFQKQHLADQMLVKKRSKDFQSFAGLGISVDGSAFYPAIEDYYGTGELPFLRVKDVDSVIDFEGCLRIPSELCNRFPTLARVHDGDIVLTKGGSVARVGLVKEEAAASRDLIFLNSSILPANDRIFLYLYAQTNFFNRVLLRSSSQTAQPHLTITLVRNLPTLRASSEMKLRCSQLVEKAYKARDEALSKSHEAGTCLTSALGVASWNPPSSLSCIRRFSEVQAHERIDAEHYREEFYAATRRLKKAGAIRFVPMDELLTSLTNGHTPLRHNLEEGEVPFLCAEHVTNFQISFDTEKRVLLEHHKSELSNTALRDGDVLLTIKGRVGNAALVDRVGGPVNINQDVALLRLNSKLPTWYVLAFINSAFGQL